MRRTSGIVPRFSSVFKRPASHTNYNRIGSLSIWPSRARKAYIYRQPSRRLWTLRTLLARLQPAQSPTKHLSSELQSNMTRTRWAWVGPSQLLAWWSDGAKCYSRIGMPPGGRWNHKRTSFATRKTLLIRSWCKVRLPQLRLDGCRIRSTQNLCKVLTKRAMGFSYRLKLPDSRLKLCLRILINWKEKRHK